jgi:hypothetical protein
MLCKNKAPLQVAYTTQTRQVARWMEEVGSIKNLHVQKYQHWKRINKKDAKVS